eukprot:3878600-Rhodomonas_salina.2
MVRGGREGERESVGGRECWRLGSHGGEGGKGSGAREGGRRVREGSCGTPPPPPQQEPPPQQPPLPPPPPPRQPLPQQA